VIGRLFGRKPTDDAPSRDAARLITPRDLGPSQEAIANEPRIEAAVVAAVDTVAVSPAAAVAAPVVPGGTAPTPAASSNVPAADAPAASATPVASASARAASGELRRDLAEAAFGREGGPLAPANLDLSIADAFDLLLAEEQGEVPTTIYGGSYRLSEADLDRIATRVVDRLTRGPLNDTVTRIVTEVSERLVREELGRMREAAGMTMDPGGDQQ
jgi:hypothetical protein